MNYIICVIAAVALAMPVSAQDMPQGNPQNQEHMGQRPQGGPQGFGYRGHGQRQRMTPEQIAKVRVDFMQKELVLTEKQYKKVFTLTLNEIEYSQALQQEAFSSMQNGGQRPEGMGQQGGMTPGQRPEGMGQQNGGQRPEGAGQWQGRPEGQRPEGAGQGYQGRRGGFQPVQLPESYVKKQDKKLQKILTPEQYAKWQTIKDKPFMGNRPGMGRGMRPGMGPVHDPKVPQGTLPANQK